MRSHLASLLVVAALVAAPADAASRSFTVTGFERLRVDGPYRVKLATGVAPFASADGSPQALEALSLEVQGRTLIIRRKASLTGASTRPASLVTINLGTHDLTAAALNGSGTLAIDKVKAQAFDLVVAGAGTATVGRLAVDRLRVAISGSASVALGGSAEAATFSVQGASALDAAGLTATSANIDSAGPATIRLTATGTAKIAAAGLGTIDLAGGPACTIRPSSTAEVSGCR